MFLQDADNDPRIGHTRDFDIVKIINDAEALCEGRFERMHAGATRMDKRSIDVEQEEALLHCSHVFFFSGPESVRGCICLATQRLSGPLEVWCVHREHRDHAAKKYHRQHS